MSDIKLFRIAGATAKEIHGAASNLEKPLQTLIEANLETLLGIRFLATEHSTGKAHRGRIDTLGLDENQCPVIIEYKRTIQQNIINQGLSYLNWLMDHQGEFKLLVLDRFGKTPANNIDWTSPRLICIAADFTKFDSDAVEQMNRSIELVRYRQFGEDLLLLELVNAVVADTPGGKKSKNAKNTAPDRSVAEWLTELTPTVREILDALERYTISLGDDVQRKDLKLYVAFKRLRNFATVCFQKNNLVVYLHIDPDRISMVDGFSRDVRKIGHWGTGTTLQIQITRRRAFRSRHRRNPHDHAA